MTTRKTKQSGKTDADPPVSFNLDIRFRKYNKFPGCEEKDADVVREAVLKAAGKRFFTFHSYNPRDRYEKTMFFSCDTPYDLIQVMNRIKAANIAGLSYETHGWDSVNDVGFSFEVDDE